MSRSNHLTDRVEEASALLKLAERLDVSACSDAEHAINNMLYAERADRKFRIAAALRAIAHQKEKDNG